MLQHGKRGQVNNVCVCGGGGGGVSHHEGGVGTTR